jgi:transposase
VVGVRLSGEQFELIEHLLPKQRGNVAIDNLTFLNAVLYVAVNGCTWRGLPRTYGRWHTVYTRMSRWAKAGVLDRVFEELQLLNVVRVKIEVVSIDSTSVKVHGGGTDALKTGALKPSAGAVADSTPRFIWLPRVAGKSSASA